MKCPALLLCLSAAILPAYLPVHAAAGELCLVPPMNAMNEQRAGMIDNQDIYHCPTPGQVTIPQVYEKGWRVVQMISTSPQLGTPMIQKVILIERL